MSKENKTENKKTTGVYWGIIAVVVAAGLFFAFKTAEDENSTKSDEMITAQVVTPKEEKTIGRIDISTKLVDADKPQIEAYVNGSDTPLEQAKWMPKLDKQGYVIQGDNQSLDVVIKILKDADVTLALRGKDVRDENRKFLPVWVDFTSLTLNGKEILPTKTAVWHNKPFIYKFSAKASEEYKIHAEWQNHTKE